MDNIKPKKKKLISWKEIVDFFKNAFWFLKLAFPYAPLEFSMTIVDKLRGVFITLFNSYLTARIIDVLTHIDKNSWSWGNFFLGREYLGKLIWIMLIINLCSYILSHWAYYFSIRLRIRLQSFYYDIFKQIIDLDLEYHESPKVSKKIQ